MYILACIVLLKQKQKGRTMSNATWTLVQNSTEVDWLAPLPSSPETSDNESDDEENPIPKKKARGPSRDIPRKHDGQAQKKRQNTAEDPNKTQVSFIDKTKL